VKASRTRMSCTFIRHPLMPWLWWHWVAAFLAAVLRRSPLACRGRSFHGSEDSQTQGQGCSGFKEGRPICRRINLSPWKAGLAPSHERAGVFSICGPICWRLTGHSAGFCWTAAGPQQRVAGFARSDFSPEPIPAVFPADDPFIQAVAHCRLTVSIYFSSLLDWRHTNR
jgi:hypothetical protein